MLDRWDAYPKPMMKLQAKARLVQILTSLQERYTSFTDWKDRAESSGAQVKKVNEADDMVQWQAIDQNGVCGYFNTRGRTSDGDGRLNAGGQTTDQMSH